MPHLRPLSAVTAATLAVLLAACGSNGSGGGTSADDLSSFEERIKSSATVANHLGGFPGSVECPDDATVETGEEFDCTLKWVARAA